jgi:hypothetical protein
MKDIIYLINADDDQFKIGITTEKGLKTRIKNLQTGSSTELRLITTYKTKYASIIEKTLHRQYQFKKIIGEWFQLTPQEVFTFIETCSIIENNIKILEEQNNHYILKTLKK